MSLRFHFLSPKLLLHHQPTKLKPHLLSPPSLTTTHLPNPKISCAQHTNPLKDSDLATEIGKMSTQLAQREEAMRRSRELLFTELCSYMGLKAEEAGKKWREMEEDEKWVLVRGFVLDWGERFQPLSGKAVKQLVDEYLVQQRSSPTSPKPTSSSSSSSSSVLFPGLKKLIGF